MMDGRDCFPPSVLHLRALLTGCHQLSFAACDVEAQLERDLGELANMPGSLPLRPLRGEDTLPAGAGRAHAPSPGCCLL